MIKAELNKNEAKKKIGRNNIEIKKIFSFFSTGFTETADSLRFVYQDIRENLTDFPPCQYVTHQDMHS